MGQIDEDGAVDARKPGVQVFLLDVFEPPARAIFLLKAVEVDVMLLAFDVDDVIEADPRRKRPVFDGRLFADRLGEMGEDAGQLEGEEVVFDGLDEVIKGAHFISFDGELA